MKEDKYLEHIANTSYKNIVKNVTSTDTNKAFFEEDVSPLPRIDANAVLLDYSYIPEKPEDCTWKNNIYSINLKESNIQILEKFEDVELQHLKGTIFKSDKLIDVIQNEHYHLIIKDANNEIIPFGLKKWTTDAGLGYLSFIEGLPDYTLPFKISGYRYIGRKLVDHMITTDGKTSMLPDYFPTEPQDVSTKKYVDIVAKQIDDYASLMKPPKPATFENKELTFICDIDFKSRDLVNGTEYEHTTLHNKKFIIDIPEFYNPGVGVVELLIFHNSVWWQLYTAKLFDNDIEDVGFIVTHKGDAYRDTLGSRGFYNSIKMHTEFSFDDIPSLMKSFTNPLLIKMRYSHLGEIIESKELLIGMEKVQLKDVIQNDPLRMRPDMGYHTRYVSGVPTPSLGSTLIIDKVDFFTLQNVTRDTKTHEVCFFDTTIEHLPKSNYSSYTPTISLEDRIKIPENYYNEKLSIELKSYNVFEEQNGYQKEEFNYRIDTVSDEKDRVFSGVENNDTIENYGSVWDPKKDLTQLNELQMLNGKYQWPEINFSINGTGIDFPGQFDPSFIIRGPDYSKCSKLGTRFVTIKKEIPLSNGVFLSFLNSEYLKQNKDTKAYNLSFLYIKVENETDWLDALKPYDGIGINNTWMQGCLAAQKSKYGTIYCTFGPKPISGTLFVRAGISYDSGIKFSEIHVETN